jgi:hypothetical protein
MSTLLPEKLKEAKLLLNRLSSIVKQLETPSHTRSDTHRRTRSATPRREWSRTLADIISDAKKLLDHLNEGIIGTSDFELEDSLRESSNSKHANQSKQSLASVSQPTKEQLTPGGKDRRKKRRRCTPAIAPNPSSSTKIAKQAAIAPTTNDDSSSQECPLETLRFTCEASDLGDKMAFTLSKAIAALEERDMTDYGYLILDVKSLPTVDWAEVSQTTIKPKKDEITGFRFDKGPQGIAHSFRTTRTVDFVFPDFSSPDSKFSNDNPEQNFQDLIDSPPEGDLAYYVGVPLFELPFTNLVHPGDKLLKRGDGNLSGINTAYWYSCRDRGGSAPLHFEDVEMASSNILVAGRAKVWMFIHESSRSALEECLRAEFPKSKNCSQFVRHHNILVSPEWLRERNIQFSIVTQYPGQMICTLPGAYHQVTNLGPNFAVAINFELSHWPDDPTEYKWCKKGARHCGRYALTKGDFTLPLSSPGTSLQTPIEIPDSPEDISTQKYLPITNVPEEHPDPSEDVKNLVHYLAKNLSPHLLGCQSIETMTEWLEQFLPGRWLNDVLLRKVLQVICPSDQFLVVESLKLEIWAPQKADLVNELQDKRGLIFPFNVNEDKQSSPTEPKNHWVLGIFDPLKMQFTSFGIDTMLATRWASELENKMRGVLKADCKILLEVERLPRPDATSCALMCCLSLEKYLGHYSYPIEPLKLRSRYLRKLLDAFVYSSHPKELTGDSPMDLVPSTSRVVPEPFLDETENRTMSDKEALLHDLNLSVDEPYSLCLKDALTDKDCSLTLERKARALQMIMQCSTSTIERLFGPKHDKKVDQVRPQTFDDNPNTHPILVLVEEIDRGGDDLFIPEILQRIRYIQLAERFQCEVELETKNMAQERLLRNRCSAAGQPMAPHKDSGKTAKSRVLDRLTRAEEATPKTRRMLRARLNTYIATGTNLRSLCWKLGPSVLYTLPAGTAYECELHLTFPEGSSRFPVLAKSIESSA